MPDAVLLEPEPNPLLTAVAEAPALAEEPEAEVAEDLAEMIVLVVP